MITSMRFTPSVVLVDENNIRKLPEDDVPECIWTTIERTENTEEANAERTGIVDDPLANVIIPNEFVTESNPPLNTRCVDTIK